MQTVVFEGNSTVSVQSRPVPKPTAGEVLIQVGASAICGSEMKTYRGPAGHASNPGHEIVGTVVENPGGQGPAVGDRVAVNIITGCGHCVSCLSGDRRFCRDQGYVYGGHAEYVVAPAVCCMPLPDDLAFEPGVLIGGDTLGVAFHALKKCVPAPRETVVVVGCGPVGLGFVKLLGFYGVRTIAVEQTAYRRELAAQVGATEVLDPSTINALEAILDLTSGRGADIGIDASGAHSGVNLALDAVRDQGRFIFGGAGREATINPWRQFLEKELTAYGVWYFVDADYHALVDLWRQGLRVDDLVTHRFALEQAPRAYDRFANGESGKVIFTPEPGRA